MPVAGSTDPHVQLFKARVRHIDKHGQVIQGVEEVRRRKECTEHRQALWAWPIDPSDLRPPPPDPLALEDEAEALRAALR